MRKIVFINASRAFSWTLMVALAAYLAIANTLPFGAQAGYVQSEGSVSRLGPASRIEIATTTGGGFFTRQKDDLIYFTTPFPYRFDAANVRITFKNPNAEQPVELGYKDRVEWHYSTQLFDDLISHQPGWHSVGSGPVLYQKKSDYDSVEEFLAKPPAKVIGTFDYSLSTKETVIPDYAPSATTTAIDTPLRGAHAMYVYVKDEPFYMKIVKQDLNWYADPDVMVIKIFREDDLVYTVTIDDDGVATPSGRIGPEEVAEIRNPGPGLPEPGVYKIVIDSTPDSVIKRIETNLHKIVFIGPIYPAFNSDIYPSIVREKSPTTVYTNSSKITAQTQHDSSTQNLVVNGISVALRQRSEPKIITAGKPISTVVMPESDVIMNGIGYFAFSAEQFFLPNQYRILPIASTADLDLVDYVLDPYSPGATTTDGYTVVERSFPLKSAVPDRGRLSWMIRAPGLKENEGEIEIKDISVTYTRNGWWK